VRCPDMRAIYLRAQQIRDSHQICKYGFLESECQTWQKSLTIFQNVKCNGCEGRCLLAGQDNCPGSKLRKQTGLETKSFEITNQVYRKIASSAHYLVKESKSKTLFLTLTFPKFKKYVTPNEINKYFSRFVENLRKNYNCGGYIAVREYGKNTNRVHFHLLLSIPFVPYSLLNYSWCNCIKDICDSSKNAIQSDPKTRFIDRPDRAMRYVCKYFAKGKGVKSESRLYFVSNNILQKPKNYTGATDTGLLNNFKFDYVSQSDYTTTFRISDSKEFARFCDKFLYPFFELSCKKPEKLYAFPVNSS